MTSDHDGRQTGLDGWHGRRNVVTSKLGSIWTDMRIHVIHNGYSVCKVEIFA